MDWPPTPPLEPDPVIEAYKERIDRSLLRERLKRTPTERIEDLASLAAFAEELSRAKRREERPKDLEAVAELEALRDEQNRP